VIRRTLPIVLGIACADIAQAEMPPELVELLARPEVPETARTELEAGGISVWVLERDSGAEQISVAGVVKIPGSPQRVSEDLFRRDSLLEEDLLEASGTFSEPAVLGDVAKYRVPESDLEVLADCEIHACKFKLGARALEELGAIDWDSPDARRNVDALVVRTHLRDYPRTRFGGARDRLHWNVRSHGYRPVTSILHTVAFDPGAGEPTRLIAAETLYSSHYFYARLQLLGLYQDSEEREQSYAIYVDRLLFDDKVGSIQRRILRSHVVGDVGKRLEQVGERFRRLP